MFVAGRKYPDGTVAGDYKPGTSGGTTEGGATTGGIDFTETSKTLISSSN